MHAHRGPLRRHARPRRHRARSLAQVDAALAGGARAGPVPQQDRRPGAAARAGARARAAVPRHHGARSSSTTTSTSRSQSTPTACISAATTARSPRRAQRLGPDRIIGVSCYRRSRTRSKRRAQGATTSRSAASFRRSVKPGAVRRAARDFSAKRSAGSACPSSRSAASPWTMRPRSIAPAPTRRGDHGAVRRARRHARRRSAFSALFAR